MIDYIFKKMIFSSIMIMYFDKEQTLILGRIYMISYKKLFALMEKQGKKKKDLREEKIIGQETLRKLILGTGVLEEYDYKVPGTKDPVVIEKRTREISVDTKSIESLCTWLNCQPNDIMEVIPNTWENAEKLCVALGIDKEPLNNEELSKRVIMK